MPHLPTVTAILRMNKFLILLPPRNFIDLLGNRIKISHHALVSLRQYIQDNESKPEAGGVLLGRYIIGNNDVVVDQITVPLADDKRSRFRFFRSAPEHQKHINKAWKTSGGTCNYLGEWHTHPELEPQPSPLDIVGWKEKLKYDVFDSEFLYFIILGTGKMNIWKGKRKDLSFEKLVEITSIQE